MGLPMLDVLDWRRDPRTRTVHRAAEALAGGRIVAFPTDTTYVLAASALSAEAVSRLDGNPDAGYLLAMRDAAEALDWVPAMSPFARRLARRSWPGPVELLWPQASASELTRRLPESVRARLCASGNIGLRSPGHAAFLDVLAQTAGPVVFRAVRTGAEEEAIAAEEVIVAEAERAELVINDGPTRYRGPATAVRIEGDSWNVVREGVVSRDLLARLGSCMIVFVCTGNTCRSPMAEALCKKLLAERVGCGPDELPARGFVVQSAGLSAMPGGPAAAEAVSAVQPYGADLSRHASQPVNVDMVAHADHLLAMTEGHLRLLTRQFPEFNTRPRLLCADGHDIPDPIGCSEQVYRDCAQTIVRHLERFLPEVHPT
jgi:protein-tyrosine phosphatase